MHTVPPIPSAARPLRVRRVSAIATLWPLLLGCGGGDGPSAPSEPAGVFFASPAGTSLADGSRERPWDLETALGARLRPGDTLWLRAGTYRGSFVSHLVGREGAPIVVRQVPGERVTIDGALRIRGGHTWFWGLEVTSSDPGRFSSRPGPAPGDVPRQRHTVDMEAPGVKLINVVLHDLGQGVGMWTTAPDAEVYGSVIYNNGWQGPDRGHGHGIYVQNDAGGKHIADNVVFQNFSMGVQAFGTNAPVRAITLTGNVLFNSGVLARDGGQDLLAWGAAQPVQDFVATDNLVYRSDRGPAASLGSGGGPTERSARLESNYVVGQVAISAWESFGFLGNTVVGDVGYLVSIAAGGTPATRYEMETNRYFHAGSGQPFLWVGAGFLGLGGWQALGLDATSSLVRDVPAGPHVLFRPNRYEPDRAMVAVHNPRGAPSVQVDVSRVLEPGTRYEVRDVQDLYGEPVAGGIYGGEPVGIPLRPRDPPRPVGGATRTPLPTGPEFQAFIILPAGRLGTP